MPITVPSPTLTIGQRRWFIVRAPFGDLADSEYDRGRRILTVRWIAGPWRLVTTGTRQQYADRRARYLTRMCRGTRGRFHPETNLTGARRAAR